MIGRRRPPAGNGTPLAQRENAIDFTSKGWPSRRRFGARNYVIWAGSCVYAAVLLYLVAVTGPDMRAQAEVQMAGEIEEENRTVCERLRMGPGSGAAYQVCAAELRDARRRHEGRIEARNQRLFL